MYMYVVSCSSLYKRTEHGTRNAERPYHHSHGRSSRTLIEFDLFYNLSSTIYRSGSNDGRYKTSPGANSNSILLGFDSIRFCLDSSTLQVQKRLGALYSYFVFALMHQIDREPIPLRMLVSTPLSGKRQRCNARAPPQPQQPTYYQFPDFNLS
jgi:hypothetical protein